MERRDLIKGGLAALLASLAPGCVRTYLADDLFVKNGFSQPHAFMTRRQGEDRLVELAGTFKTKVEELWLVLQAEDHNVCLWRDIGLFQKIDETSVHVSSERDSFFLELIQTYRDHIKDKSKPISFSYYHIHPVNAIIDHLINDTRNYDPRSNPLTQDFLDIFSLPSIGDFLVYIERYGKFNHKYAIGPSRVVGPLGVFSYSATVEYMRKMQEFVLRSDWDNPKREALVYLKQNVNIARYKAFDERNVEAAVNCLSEQGLPTTFERRRAMPDPIRYERGKETPDPVYVAVK